MHSLRFAIILFVFALSISNASAQQLIHSSVVSHTIAAKPIDPVSAKDSSTVNVGVNQTSSVSTASAAHAGMVITNAWPNPLHPASTLHLEVLSDRQGSVTAGIYDLDGSEKGTLDLGQLNSGTNELQVDFPDLPSGEYIVRMQQGSDTPEIVRINYIK